MNITEIKIRKKENHGALKAVVSLIIDGNFALNDIRLIQTAEARMLVKYPVNDKGKSFMAPLSNIARLNIEDKIIRTYYNA